VENSFKNVLRVRIMNNVVLLRKSYLDKRLFKSVSPLNADVSLSVSNVVNYTAHEAG